jgi:5-methylthioadenosine/S-adenosylhomocysteine deaminase
LHNATILTMNPRREVLLGGSIRIEGDRILEVGRIASAESTPHTEVIDVHGKIIVPGLVNCHAHTSQQLARGLADDVDLLTWLRDRIWPFESALTPEDQYVSSLAFGLEMIRSGVTAFSEAGGQHIDAMGRAVTELGLRATLCQSSMDSGRGLPAGWVLPTDQVIARQEEQYDRWHGTADGRIRQWFGLRTIFNCSDELIRKTMDAAERLATGVQMHVAEIPQENQFSSAVRGARTVEHLSRLGALRSNLLAVHCVWLNQHEIDLFARHDVKVAHCVTSNLRVLGVAPVPEMLAKGLDIGLGTDSPPACNRSDMIDEMYLVALVHKGHRFNQTIVPAESVMDMATIGGARCLHWEREIGSLEPGKKADLVIIDPRDVGCLPIHNPVSALVYSMHSRCIESTMCNGRWLMKDRRVLVLDEQALLDEISRRASAIAERAGVRPISAFPFIQV